ncbi:MAG: S41 family peptidase [Cyclobacteriaceae bacterium]
MIFIFICTVALGLSLETKAQNLTVCQEGSMLIATINDKHIEPIVNDSLWSQSLFEKVFTVIDPNGRLFTKDDIANLREFSGQLTRETLKRNCQFIDKLDFLYQSRLKRLEKFIDSLSHIPVKQFPTDKISPFLNITTFCNSTEALYVRWQNQFSIQIILQTIRIGQSNKIDFSKDDFHDFEISGRTKVFIRERKEIQQRLKDTSIIRNAFLQAIAQNFDPHTQYFSSGEINSFQSSMDKTMDSFGLQFSENQMGEIIVAKIIPAGPAWKSNSIHNGDQLINFKFSDGELIDAFDFDDDEINEMLSQSGQLADFTFKRTDGQVIKVILEKSKLENTDNSVSSLILKGQNKFGYISLPSFYTNSEDINDNGCANDVAKEIIKLKKENIDGLILDLRFNGGGSMYEAVGLAGIFIDYGTLALVQLADKSIISLKDLNKGTVYDGPLVVMVNSASASASELVAIALQDYNRALIVGSSTYGKATGQVVLPAKEGTQEPTDFVKVTMERIYRVSGKSYQKKGVQVDFPLPDLTETLVYPESSFPNAITNRPIVKKVYFTPGKDLQLSALKANSKLRIQESEKFNAVISLIEKFKVSISLNPESFLNYFEDLKSLYSVLEKSDDYNIYEVSQNRFENDLLMVSEYQKEISTNNIQEIQNSFYITEAYQILSEYLAQLEK